MYALHWNQHKRFQWNCFPLSENITKCMQAYIYSVSLSYYFRFLLFVFKSNLKFCHKNVLLLIVSHYHWTLNWKSFNTDEIWNPRARVGCVRQGFLPRLKCDLKPLVLYLYCSFFAAYVRHKLARHIVFPAFAWQLTQ